MAHIFMVLSLAMLRCAKHWQQKQPHIMTVQLQLITSQSPLAVIRRLPPPFHRFALRGMKSSFQPHGISIIKCGWTCLGLHLYLCQLALIYCQSAGEAAKLITARTRAIALVSPNNPAGVEYPAELLLDFYELAKAHGIALIVDETYRDYHSQDGAPHALFSQPNALDTFIHLYSFSKAFRLTGHRVGALITSKARLGEIEKFLDTVAICPGQIGQAAALWGLENLSDWLAEERNEIIRRCGAIKAGFPTLAAKGWELKSAGAYFAYMKHPFDISSADLAPRLVSESGILCLPGTMFCPTDDPSGAQHLRIAFANLDANGIATLYQRLAALNI